MSTPAECQPIADKVKALEFDRKGLQEQLQQAPTAAKPFWARRIKALNSAIAAERNKLTDCLATHPREEPPPPLASTLSGVVTLSSLPQAPGPFSSPTTVGVIFDGPRTLVVFTAVSPIVASYDTPAGHNTTTVTKVGGGVGGYSAGHMSVPLKLHFDHSIDIPFFEEDSDLEVVLATTPPGSAVDANGAVTLTGTGYFKGGFLANATGTITLTGIFSPAP